MEFPDIVRAGFRDELEKISGMTRIGRPPVTVANAVAGRGKFFKGMGKLSAAAPAAPRTFGPKALAGALATGAVLGGVGVHQGKKALDDYKMGRAVRQANTQQGA